MENNEANLLDACRSLSREGMLNLVDAIVLFIRMYSVAVRGDKLLIII